MEYDWVVMSEENSLGKKLRKWVTNPDGFHALPKGLDSFLNAPPRYHLRSSLIMNMNVEEYAARREEINAASEDELRTMVVNLAIEDYKREHNISQQPSSSSSQTVPESDKNTTSNETQSLSTEDKRSTQETTSPVSIPSRFILPTFDQPNLAIGHAQAAEQANMARRARVFGMNSGQPSPTETPLPYNPPTTTPEFRGLQNSNRPRPVGPTPSQNGRI